MKRMYVNYAGPFKIGDWVWRHEVEWYEWDGLKFVCVAWGPQWRPSSLAGQRLDSFIDGVAGKRLTYKALIQ